MAEVTMTWTMEEARACVSLVDAAIRAAGAQAVPLAALVLPKFDAFKALGAQETQQVPAAVAKALDQRAKAKTKTKKK